MVQRIHRRFDSVEGKADVEKLRMMYGWIRQKAITCDEFLMLLGEKKVPERVEDPIPATTQDTAPDWTRKCENCDQSPVVPATGLCGPCTFGEADTVGGNW